MSERYYEINSIKLVEATTAAATTRRHTYSCIHMYACTICMYVYLQVRTALYFSLLIFTHIIRVYCLHNTYIKSPQCRVFPIKKLPAVIWYLSQLERARCVTLNVTNYEHTYLILNSCVYVCMHSCVTFAAFEHISAYTHSFRQMQPVILFTCELQGVWLSYVAYAWHFPCDCYLERQGTYECVCA